MTWLAQHAANAAWLVPSWLFLGGAVWTIRKARARGQRLFVDGPTARVRNLQHDTTHLHEADAFL